MKRKIVAIALVAILALVAVVGATLAYFSDKETTTNVFTVGNVEIELTETKWAGEVTDVFPGQKLEKNPCVKNVGANPCFVRIKVSGLDLFGADKLITYETGDTVGALGDGWVKGEGDYFYYTKVLTFVGDTENPTLGTQTTDLFDRICIPMAVNADDNSSKSVVVFAEAVQAQGAKDAWSDVVAMTTEEIAAWFDTCGMNKD